MLIFYMGDAAVGGQEVDTAVEVADPETSRGIGGKRRDVAVGEDGRTRFEHALPSESAGIHAIKPVAGDGKHGIARHEKLTHFGQFRRGPSVRVRVTPFQRNLDYALIFGSDINLGGSGEQRGGHDSWSKHARKTAVVENGD